MSAYYTAADWTKLLRDLPSEGALLHLNSFRVLTGLDEKTARQACWRLGRRGLLTHVGGGFYTHAFAKVRTEEAAAVLVQPSYVSLESVLGPAGVTTQPSAALTCVTTAPTQTRQTTLGEIRYHSIAKHLYWGFEARRTANRLWTFEAWPEKALADLVYLSRRRGDRVWLDLDFSRLDAKRLHEVAARFPATVQREINALRQSR